MYKSLSNRTDNNGEGTESNLKNQRIGSIDEEGMNEWRNIHRLRKYQCQQ